MKQAETTSRTAIVTGGSRGIGRAVCLELARAGVNIVCNYAGNAQAAESTVEECRALGVQAISVQANVAEVAECQRLFDTAMEQFGRVDILVNNAGITRDTLILRMSEEDLDRVLAVNLKGAFFCMKLAARIMMKQRFGRIVNMSSVVGVHGNAGQVNYAASKAGLIGMTKSLAKELAARSVTVNAVAPGFIETDMTGALTEEMKQSFLSSIPLGRFGAPEDIAKTVAFLASDGAGYITGQVLGVDGGMGM